MARLTKEERAELEARLAEDDEDDESDQVTVTRTDGSAFTGTYRRAKKLGYVTEPSPKDDGDDDKSKAPGGTRFAGRRVS